MHGELADEPLLLPRCCSPLALPTPPRSSDASATPWSSAFKKAVQHGAALAQLLGSTAFWRRSSQSHVVRPAPRSVVDDALLAVAVAKDKSLTVLIAPSSPPP